MSGNGTAVTPDTSTGGGAPEDAVAPPSAAPDPSPGTGGTAPTGTAGEPDPVTLPLVPLGSMGASSMASAASGLYAAAGVWGLAAGGAVAAGTGVALVARKRRRGSSGLGRTRTIKTSKTSSGGFQRSARSSGAARSGGLGSRSAGMPRSGRSGAGQALAGRRSAASSLGRGQSSRGGASQPGAGGASWRGKGSGAGVGSGRRSTGGLTGTGKRTGAAGRGSTGAGRGAAFGKRHGGLSPTSTRGRTGTGTRPGSTGSTSNRRGAGRVGRDGLTAAERSRVRSGMRAAHRRSNGPIPRAMRRAAARMHDHPAGRAVLAAGRGLGATARGTGRAVNWATRGRAGRAWQRARRRAPGWARRLRLRNLLAADQQFSADLATALARGLARLWQSTVAWLTGQPGTGPRWRDVGDRTTPGTGQQPNGGSTTGGTSMGYSPEARRVMAAADELHNALAAYGALGMLDYGEGLDTIPYALEKMSRGVQAMAVDALQTRPLSPAVVQFLLDLSQAITWLAVKATEVRTVFQQAHEADIIRLSGGRPNEWMWDRSANHG